MIVAIICIAVALLISYHLGTVNGSTKEYVRMFTLTANIIAEIGEDGVRRGVITKDNDGVYTWTSDKVGLVENLAERIIAANNAAKE